MPEWHLMTGTLVGIATLSVAWSPLRLAVPLCLAAILPSVAQACLGGARARFPDGLGGMARLARRILTAVLHLIQPIARLRGRSQEGLTPRAAPRCGVSTGWTRANGCGPWKRTCGRAAWAPCEAGGMAGGGWESAAGSS